MRPSSYVVPMLLALAACRDAGVTTPAAPMSRPPDSRAAVDDGTPVSYFAARTVTRESTAPQVVTFPINERDHSLFMEPFTIHVRGDGDQRIVGIVRVDGVPVLERRDLVALGSSVEPLTRQVTIGPASVVSVELQGPAGGALTFWIDAPLNPPPVITIASPQRHAGGGPGAFLQQGTLLPSPVQITGTACHPRHPIAELEVVGVAVPVTGGNLCEAFSVVQESRWGLSTITGTARTSRGRVGTVVQSYARSPEYYALASNPLLLQKVPGLFTQINQAGLDDGNRATTGDLATIIENLLNDADVTVPAATLIPCTPSGLVHLRLTGGRLFQSIRVNSARVVAGNILDIDISVLGPRFFLHVRTDVNIFDDDCVGTFVESPTASVAEVRFRAQAQLAVSPTEEDVVVQLNHSNIQSTDAQVTAMPIADGIVGMIESALNSFIGEFVADLHTPTLTSIVRGFTDGVTAPQTHDVTLEAATLRTTTGPATVLLDGAFPNGTLRFGLFSRIEPLTLDPTAISQVGPIRSLCVAWVLALPCAADTPLTAQPPFSATAYAFGLALHQDVINNTLWSAWRAGAFSVVDVAAIPGVGSGTLKASSMSLRATLPPVSMASAASDPTIEVAWGDVRVRSVFAPADVGAPGTEPIVVESWVSGAVRGNLTLDATAERLVPTDLASEVKVQLIDATLAFNDAALRAAVESDARAAILAMARNAMGLLQIDTTIGALGRLVPASMSRSGSYYVVGGGIQ